MHKKNLPLLTHATRNVNAAATALGFATTLLAASLPIAECKRRVLLYAAARPVCAFLAYSVATLSRTTPASQWPPIVILYSFTVSPAASSLPFDSIDCLLTLFIDVSPTVQLDRPGRLRHIRLETLDCQLPSDDGQDQPVRKCVSHGGWGCPTVHAVGDGNARPFRGAQRNPSRS